MTRCFLGFELTEESRAYLEAVLLPLHGHLADGLDWPVRLVRPGNWHATLLFFPELDADERATVWAAAAEAAARGVWRDLAFDWRGLSLWPTPKQPNLVCLEAAPYDGIVDGGLMPLLGRGPFRKGDVDKLHRYRPHITVMRFRRGAKRPYARQWVESASDLPEIDPARIRFDRLSFLLSTLTPEQPIYTREHSIGLR